METKQHDTEENWIKAEIEKKINFLEQNGNEKHIPKYMGTLKAVLRGKLTAMLKKELARTHSNNLMIYLKALGKQKTNSQKKIDEKKQSNPGFKSMKYKQITIITQLVKQRVCSLKKIKIDIMHQLN